MIQTNAQMMVFAVLYWESLLSKIENKEPQVLRGEAELGLV